MGLIQRFVLWNWNYQLRASVQGEYGGILLSNMTLDKKKSAAFVAFVTESLQLIEQHDPRRFRRAQYELRYIVYMPLPCEGQYREGTRHCALNCLTFDELLNAEEREWHIAYCASVIIHEATHGRLHSLGIDYTDANWERIERLCWREQERFLARLPNDEYDFTQLAPAFDSTPWKQSRQKTTWKRWQEFFAALPGFLKED